MKVDEQFENMLLGSAPAIAAVAHDVRALVQSVEPQVHEEVHAGWGGSLLFKRGSSVGNTVCWLSAHGKHVSLGFTLGGGPLPDPAGLLQGAGKNSRHLKFKKAEDVARPEVRAVVEAAWAQQPDAALLQAGIQRVRAICLSLPETSETVSHGHPTFWAGKKTFAVFGLYSASFAFKAGFELQSSLEGDPRFFPTPYLGPSGWLSMKLDADTDWDEARRLLEHSYRAVATPKLLKALDARSPSK